MTPEQKAAFINTQSVMMLCEIQGMNAENQQRAILGESVAYWEDSFQDVSQKYNGILGYNAIIDFFRD